MYKAAHTETIIIGCTVVAFDYDNNDKSSRKSYQTPCTNFIALVNRERQICHGRTENRQNDAKTCWS